MSQKKVAVVVGSLRKDSVNKKYAQALVKLASAGYHFELVALDALPVYNQDSDGNEVDAVKAFRAAIAQSQAVLFVTPEYNRSMPAVLKNALDIGSRPYGQNVWRGKPAAVVGVSPGATGTAMAQQHLRNVLSFLEMPVLSQPEMYIRATDDLFDADGGVGAVGLPYAQRFVQQFEAWIAKHA